MKLATWNINSLKVRLPQVLAWLGTHAPEALCLQETKLEELPELSPGRDRAAGYLPLFSGQKTYNGVAILTRSPAADPVMAIPGFDDPQKRVLAATVDGVRVINLCTCPMARASPRTSTATSWPGSRH